MKRTIIEQRPAISDDGIKFCWRNDVALAPAFYHIGTVTGSGVEIEGGEESKIKNGTTWKEIENATGIEDKNENQIRIKIATGIGIKSENNIEINLIDKKEGITFSVEGRRAQGGGVAHSHPSSEARRCHEPVSVQLSWVSDVVGVVSQWCRDRTSCPHGGQLILYNAVVLCSVIRIDCRGGASHRRRPPRVVSSLCRVNGYSCICEKDHGNSIYDEVKRKSNTAKQTLQIGE
ncbi:hypothetical protein EVAR_36664_1 [Eumeta japonica]|uniref:Uncharacterized protein n=1 Tax=Eumeta variegata TaxID=151549 RepID=A0A4C1XU79_EUMVA|nr:hypothetical protein EVAR_36664_1 [Eumeta japonica]